MPSITVLPDDSSAKLGYHQIAAAFGPGAPGMLQVVTTAQDAGRTTQILAGDSGIAAVLPAMPSSDGSDYQLVQAIPRVQPDDPAVQRTLDAIPAVPVQRPRTPTSKTCSTTPRRLS